ncbi:zonular occludens toxin domain-containing protein [Xanthomonas campestris pv. raphani]|uniref:zonular occludens toxin domain-containing protein n=1 Tax=Xanthomonas campestris TaxID=339 RepID=UPI00388D2436
MIYLVTGMPGNGKTLYAVDFIKKAVEKGRKVYTDIKGLTLAGVEPAPDDWRTLPDGSLVVYDEAHKRFPAFKGKGRSPLKVVQDMDEHRHRGFDMMFITQWPDKIDSELFRLVGTHWHLNRAFGLQSASLCAFTRGVMNPYSATARKGADESIWSYPKDLYNVYKSSSMHTDAHKFKLPAKIRNALITAPMICLVLWGLYAFLMPSVPKKEGPAPGERSAAETNPATVPTLGIAQPVGVSDKALATGEYTSLTGPSVPAVAGCVDSHRGCRCWNRDGLQIDQTQAECRRVVDGPLPINIYHAYTTSAPATQAPPQPAQDTPQGQGAAPPSAGVTIGRQTRAQGTFPESPGYQGQTYTGPTTLDM